MVSLMIAVIQRVSSASVIADGKFTCKINNGIAVLLGVIEADDEEDAELLSDKITNIRIFSDDSGKMNYSVKDIDGEILIVPNFTLGADYKKGNRPSYTKCAKPVEASHLFDYFCDYTKIKVSKTEHGIFGADMKFSIQNDGPVTIVLDSKVLKGKI